MVLFKRRPRVYYLLSQCLLNIVSANSLMVDCSLPSSVDILNCNPTNPANILSAIAAHLGNSIDASASAVDMPASSERSDYHDSQTLSPEKSESSGDPLVTSEDGEDEEKFLSFEEWRQLNLEKSGQQFRSDVGVHSEQKQHTVISEHESFAEAELDIDAGIFTKSDEEVIPEDIREVEAEDIASGSKTYKDRFNYASFDCAATIVKSNANMKGAGNILNENKDTYLINECKEANKFVVIELCQDILVDTVTIANYEFFSSMFRHIRFSVSDRFPVAASGWKILGDFEGTGVRDMQRFHIDNPMIWARYLRIEFLTHWGHEFYCPVSVVRVHGTTMMDQYKNQEAYVTSDNEVVSTTHENQIQHSSDQAIAEPSSLNLSTFKLFDSKVDTYHSQKASDVVDHLSLDNSILDNFATANVQESSTTESLQSHDSISDLCIDSLALDAMSLSPLILDEHCHWEEYQENAHQSPMLHTYPDVSPSSPAAVSTSAPAQQTNTSEPDCAASEQNATSAIASSSNMTKPAQASSLHDSEPRTQDSFYQTIMKRLHVLEKNATLSMQYIEIQSQNLRELLGKIEKKQTLKIETFFQEFNHSIIWQLNDFQTQYSAILSATINEAERERQKNARDMIALSSRFSLIADDLMYQRRVSMAQAFVLLIILIFVIATRGTTTDGIAGFPKSRQLTRLWGLSSPLESGASSPVRPTSIETSFDSTDEDEDEDYDEEKYDKGGLPHSPPHRYDLPRFSPAIKKQSIIYEDTEETQSFNDTGYLSPSQSEDEESLTIPFPASPSL